MIGTVVGIGREKPGRSQPGRQLLLRVISRYRDLSHSVGLLNVEPFVGRMELVASDQLARRSLLLHAEQIFYGRITGPGRVGIGRGSTLDASGFLPSIFLAGHHPAAVARSVLVPGRAVRLALRYHGSEGRGSFIRIGTHIVRGILMRWVFSFVIVEQRIRFGNPIGSRRKYPTHHRCQCANHAASHPMEQPVFGG